MNIEYIGKDYSVSDGLKKMTEKKCGKLKKYLKDQTIKFTITLVKADNASKGEYTTEAVTTFGKTEIRAEARSDSPFNNLDEIVPKLEGQMRKKKTIWGKRKKGKENDYSHLRDGEQVKPAPAPADEEPPKPEA